MLEYNINEMQDSHIKEAISTSYVIAISAYAGFNFLKYEKDYGMDGCFSGIKRRKNRIVEDGTKIDFQLKASENIEISDDSIKYNLEVKNYNDLVDEEIGTERILILYKLPKDKSKWITVENDKIIFKECAWWCCLKGKEESENSSKKTIYIPRNQVFDEKALISLMNKVRKGETL